MFRFSQSIWLLALPLIPLLALWRWKREQPSRILYSDLSLMDGLPVSARPGLRWIPAAVRTLVLVLLVLTMARPQFGRAQEIVIGRGVDIVIALDISGSMAALDFDPMNRLETAKQVIDEFIANRRHDRIGLVVFAREAFSQSPPTLDHTVLRRLLAEIELAPQLGLEDGTAIGLGIAQAATMLQDPRAQSRVIILLTDGVNNAGNASPLTVAQAAQTLGIRVYAIGVARPGLVPVPVEETISGPVTRLEESKIDEDTMQQIASVTGGLYFRAEKTSDLRQVYDQIDNLEPSDIEIQISRHYQELAGWFLGAALGLLIIELLLRHTIFRSLP